MKSLLVFVILAGVVFSLTEGFAIETQKSKAVAKCQEKKMEKLLNEIIEDTYNLKTEAYSLYQSAYTGVVECVFESFTTLVSCVQGVVEDNILDFEEEIETYLSTVQRLADKIEQYLEECF